jgi:type I restriction enzyme S subunit
MGKLDKLIEKLCPHGVEYVSLIDVCNTITTGKLNANAMVEGGQYPFFTCDENPYRIDKYAFDATAIIISGNGSKVGHINFYEGKFNAYQRTYILTDFKSIRVKFLLHYLKGTL